MAGLHNKVKLYLEANGKTEAELFDMDKIILRNKGSGDFISLWNVSGLAKPTDSQLDSYDSDATTVETNNTVRATRKKAYGDIGDQLDEIFKDIDAWKTRIQAIKDANAKE